MSQAQATGDVERAKHRIDALAAGLTALGAYHLLLGVLMATAPGTFFAEIGPFGVQNDHYIRDMATYNLALAAVLLAAVRLSSWRVPVLVVLLIQFALHAVNHLIDIGEADPASIGVVDFVTLTAGAAIIAALLARAVRDARGGRPGESAKPFGTA